MKFQGFVGPSYTLDSVNVDCQRSVNLYPELIESGTGKEGQQYYLKSTPGLEELFTVGDGPIRLVHYAAPPVDSRNDAVRVFVASGEKLFRLDYDGTNWDSLELSDGGNAFDAGDGLSPIIAVSTNNDLGETFFVDGSANAGFAIKMYSRAVTSPTTYTETLSNVEYGMLGGFFDWASTHVTFLDGYLIFNSKNSNRYYVSNWNSSVVDPTSFASSEGDPDNIMSLISNNRYLWIFNERTTEIFYNTGNADFPFERVSGGFIEKGCAARYSVAKIDGSVFWLGRNEFGHGIVYGALGLEPQRISTHAIEQAIKSYADISSAIAYTYQSGGHSFYVLSFDEMTWVYDLSTKMWHERAYTNDGSLERHRANFQAFIPSLGYHMLGDYSSNKIYKFNDEYYSDDGVEITRMRTFPHVSNGGKALLHNSLQIDMETGVGLVSGQGSDPQVVLDWSNDGGHTWSDESWTSAGGQVGGVGEYKTRVQWRRLGRARDRVYRIKITDPVPVTIMSADIEVKSGRS